MPLDQELLQALGQYADLRKRIGRGISTQLLGVPLFGGRDMLQWIARLEKPNVTTLSEAMGITRGGASKAVAKLRAAGLVAAYQLSGNRKEVYYQLTPSGEERMAALRNTLDTLARQELHFFEQLPESQKEAVLSFLNGFITYLNSEWPPQALWEEGDA